MSQTNLNRRVTKARYAVNAAVLQKVPGGFRVPSRTQVHHHIVLAHYQKRQEGAGYRMTCHYEHGHGQYRCPGNQFGHICWHCLAALIKAVGKKQVAFFEDLSEARRYQNLGGKMCMIWSGDGSGKLFAVVR